MSTKWKVFCVAIGIAEATAIGARSEEIEHTAVLDSGNMVLPTRFVPFSRTDTNTANRSLGVPQFDQSMGLLQAVEIEVTAHTDAAWHGEVVDDPGICAGANANMRVRYQHSPPGASAFGHEAFFNRTECFTSSVLVWDFNYPARNSTAGPVTPTVLDAYIGSGTVSVPIRIDFIQEVTISNTGCVYNFSADVDLEVTVRYIYSPGSLPGDLNCDGVVSVGDVNPFVLALTDPQAYEAQFPNCDVLNADCSGDGAVTVNDINCFVAMLSGS